MDEIWIWLWLDYVSISPRLSNVDNWIANVCFLFLHSVAFDLVYLTSRTLILFQKGGLHYDPGVNKCIGIKYLYLTEIRKQE